MAGRPTPGSCAEIEEHTATPSRQPIVLANKPGLRSMVAHLLSPQRTDPVVAVAASTETGEPVLSYEQVRSVVGAEARVYFISPEFLLARLEGKLGPRLALRADAIRVWWPDLNTRSDPGDHPLTLALDSESSESLLEDFASAFDLTRPRVRAAIKLNSEIGVLDARRVTEANQRAASAKARAQAAHRERDEAIARAQKAETQAKALNDLPIDKRLHALITREWLECFTSQERREHNLNYILSQRFVTAVAAQPHLRLDRLAWICMILASRSELKVRGLEPHQLLSGAQGSAQVERDDGAKAWRCKATGLTPGRGPRLHYWILPSQTVEFHNAGGHDLALN